MTITTPVCTAVPNSAMKPDPDRDREVVAEQPEQIDAAGQRERNRQQHVRRFDRGVIGEVEQDEDDEQHDRHARSAAAAARAPGSPSGRSTRRSSRQAATTSRATAAAPPRRIRRRRAPARSAAPWPAAARSPTRSWPDRARARCARAGRSGTCVPAGRGDQDLPSACGSARYSGAYRTRTGNRCRPSIVIVSTVSPMALSMTCCTSPTPRP